MYRIVAITARPGYRGMYGESTNLSWKPLYLRNTSLFSVMAREACGAIRTGYAISPGRYDLTRTWEQVTPSYPCSPGLPGVKQAPNHPMG